VRDGDTFGGLRAARLWRWEWLLAVVLAAGAARDAWVLTRSAVALGIDGYYYVLQVERLRDYGHFYYPTRTPLILYLLYGVSLLTGDALTAVKLCGVFLHALLCLGVYAVLFAATGRKWPGVLGSALAAAAGLHVYLITEFINSLGALTLLVWSAWGAIRAFQTGVKRWFALSASLLAAAFLSHRVALSLVLVVTVSALLARWLTAAGPSRNRYAYAAAAIFVLLFCSPALLLAQPFFELPGWLRKEFLVAPRWPLRRFDVAEGLMLLVASPAALLAVRLAAGARRAGIAAQVFATVALWSLLIPLNPFLNHNTGFLGVVGRLSSVLYIQAAVLVPGLIWLLAPRWPRARLPLVLAALALSALSVSAPLPYGATADYLKGRERLIRQLEARRPRLCDEPLVIAPHGEQFVVTAVLGVPAQQRPPSATRPQCTYWLLHGVRGPLLQGGLEVLGEDAPGLVSALVEDGELRQLLGGMAGGERRQLMAANPHLREALRGRPGVPE